MEWCENCFKYHPRYVPCDKVEAFFDAVEAAYAVVSADVTEA